MYLSIIKPGHDLVFETTACALNWSALPTMEDTHPAGVARIGTYPRADLVFVLSTSSLAGKHVIAQQEVAMPDGPALMRIDEVCFPVGAIAHRHTHSGAGFRYLVRGTLRIETEPHSQVMTVGDNWFEPADTPVRAVAMQDAGVTSFVRCMILSATLEGKSTFQQVDPVDAKLPRLQMTHRHIDHTISVDAG
jgi:quercetin dioxygenase-like cupin family protein